MEIYNNTNLQDLEGELWVDAFGHDGVYEVSSLGRFKSLQREANTRWGTPRMIQEKILKQTVKKHTSGRIDGINVHLGKSTNATKFVYQSFFPEDVFLKNDCVMHLNKNSLDNRLVNLKKSTRKKSKITDMVKSKRTIIAVPKNLNKAQDANKEFYNNRTHKQCSRCNTIDLVDSFLKNRSKCQKCINTLVIDRRKAYKYTDIEKRCKKCFEVKKDIEFPKIESTCKKCKYEAHRQYMIKRNSK
jgi:uncharacterized protein (DUF983 family)